MNKNRALSLTEWFQKNQRDLPWRKTYDPYDVWLSEIMLQQTRVEFVKDRFLRFQQELPDIPSLAGCDEEKLMKLWEGMGYYSRARNLKKCAEMLMREYDGKLPASCDALRKLPGIGPYTAGAIASIAFLIPSPAVDGNVMRVLARVTGDRSDIRSDETKKKYTAHLMEFLDHNAPSISKQQPAFVRYFTQGLMELGAIVCLPNGEPLCPQCPWAKECQAHQNHETDSIPVRSEKKQRTIQERTVLIIRDGDRFLLHRRGKKGLLAGLMEFPAIERYVTSSEAIHALEKSGIKALRIHPLPASKHIFTHIEWHMKAYEILVEACEELNQENLFWMNQKELQSIAVPSAFRTYLDYYNLR